MKIPEDRQPEKDPFLASEDIGFDGIMRREPEDRSDKIIQTSRTTPVDDFSIPNKDGFQAAREELLDKNPDRPFIGYIKLPGEKTYDHRYLNPHMHRNDRESSQRPTYTYQPLFSGSRPNIGMGGSVESAPTPPKQEKPEKTGPTLDDIGGYDDAKSQVRKFLAAAQHPEKFKEWGAKPPKGLLLYGPPGTGKTMFAKAIATELDGHFESISPADINSKWFGESEERIKKLFEEARERPGHTVIFIDEIDSMLPQRNSHTSGGVKDSIMTMFLQYMDGKDSPDNVTLVGATNRLDAIDAAVLRPGRFDRKIEIGYPDPEARASILGIHIAQKEKDAGRKLFDLDEQALDKLLRGADVLTGAQIAEVVRRVCETKAYESIENGESKLANVDDLVAAFASLIAETARYDA